MTRKTFLVACAIVAASAAFHGASATPRWPGNILGTWKGTSNQSPIVLTVSAQSSGANECDNISGTIQDVNGGFSGPMLGYYCPASGAVEFLRYPTTGNVPFQVYTANVSQTEPPAGVHGILMGGVFEQYSLAYGPLGKYSFSLLK